MFNYVALVSQSASVQNWELQIVAAALQTQVARDFIPIWGVDGTVSAFDLIQDVPTGFWPIIIRDDIGFPGAAGIHLDRNKKPFGLVQASNRWPMTASHEILEMLVDPMGNRTRSASSIKPEQGMVDYLVEVCDPSEAEQFGYQINGVWVSDFYTPEFFLSLKSGNVRYSFTGALANPLTVLEGGYVSWHDPESDHWWQQTWFGGAEPQFVDLGIIPQASPSPRAWIDLETVKVRKQPPSLVGIDPNSKLVTDQQNLYKQINTTNKQNADRLLSQIEELRTSYG